MPSKASSTAPIEDQLEGVPGFGRCDRCSYLETGSPALCLACARRSFEPLDARRCDVCDGTIEADGRHNPICGWSYPEERYFEWCCAIAKRTGELERGISRFKYMEKLGWGKIFGRVLAGFLNANPQRFRAFDLVVASPTHRTARSELDHTAHVLRAAAREITFCSCDVGPHTAIVKTRATPSMVKCKGWKERHDVATTRLRPALHVPNPRAVRGLSILVYDDVFTGGHTLNEVALALRNAGAKRVCGVVLARQPYGKSAAKDSPA